jgi:hypothetical protein
MTRRIVGLVVTFATSAWLGCSGSTSSDDPSLTGDGGGGTGTGTGTPTGSGAGGSGSGGSGGGHSGDWQTLIAGDWTLPGGTESYSCVVATVPDDLYITAFRPVAPAGTHHTVLTRAPGGEDGIFPCDAGTNGQNMIFGSGVGATTFELPEGVAVKVSAGEKLLLNLHLFNVNGTPIGGNSGVEVRVMDPSDVVHEAEAALAGTQSITLDPMSAGSAVGACTIPSPVTLFGVFPHMHQLGVHMNVRANGEVVLDAPFTFDDQSWSAVAPQVDLAAGDQVVVDCSYENTTNNTVNFGDSSTAEMCFAGLFVYPAGALNFICDN